MDLDGDIETQEAVIRDCAGTMYAAGTHTVRLLPLLHVPTSPSCFRKQTAASIISFVLAMIQFPEVQQRAQEEIDRVIGSERLPNFSDREDLPYLDCVLKELQRWTVPTPVGKQVLASLGVKPSDSMFGEVRNAALCRGR